ncbi:hypothetical protein C0989_008066 [Termitomyces sp. Mn162]|nr:hypothetical protein C0989_008066 [Termitomyces sp. Mn162]
MANESAFSTPSTSTLSASPLSQPSHIDLTQDEDDFNDHYGTEHSAKRVRLDQLISRLDHSTGPNIFMNQHDTHSNALARSPSFNQNFGTPTSGSPVTNPGILQHAYRPAFAGPSSFLLPRHPQVQSPSPSSPHIPPPLTHPPSMPIPSNRQVIDLTGSPSPPPSIQQQQATMPSLPPDLPPKTPVCIGQLNATALVLYPVPYLCQQDLSNDSEWAPVRLQYECNPNKSGGPATIHIKVPPARGLNGEQIPGEAFGVVEQKVATAIGPMLGKGLIRVDAKVRKGPTNLPILPLQMLVYTPKGNIPVVGSYLRQVALLLDHPASSCDAQRLANFHYHNPHNPPPGGHNRMIMAQNRLYGPSVSNNTHWSAPSLAGKSMEVQRSQIDEVFKNLKDGDELTETEPAPEVATRLYPHQKKALTFLLEREREKLGSDGNFSSLWQSRANPLSGQVSWFHIVTQKEVLQKPYESKGAILADDMGLGKTITCVSLIAATLGSARTFAGTPLELPPPPPPPPRNDNSVDPNHFAGSVWGMPAPDPVASQKQKAKNAKLQEKLEADYIRASRIRTKSRATLIVCPLSTVSNWEDQLREHWNGEVTVFGGSGGTYAPSTPSQSMSQLSLTLPSMDDDAEAKPLPRVYSGAPLRVYIYHGNARRPDPTFLADFDCVITTFATLASEFSKQNRCAAIADEDEDDGASSDTIGADFDEHGNQIVKITKAKKSGLKRKKSTITGTGNCEATSALQSIHWFRVVLDEAHSIKETGTVGSRASCDLMADRRLCLTGTPVQNKLDDVFALIKFLRLEPFNDKNIWTEFIGSPVKFGQALGIARLQTIMKCITLRRTKETKNQDGQNILALPPRRDELRLLKFCPEEQGIYDRFFNESKAEFTEMTSKNEVMKNYVGILQKILRLRQICDHFELVQGKGPDQTVSQESTASYEDLVADISKDGLNATRAAAIFAILRESATTQCVECGGELCIPADSPGDGLEVEGPSTAKRGHAVEIKPELLDVTALKKKPRKREKRQKGVPTEHFQSSTKVNALMTDLISFSRANPHSANYDPSSIEVQMVDDKGNQVDDGVVKTVVFSQWTTMLDKIEDALEQHCIQYDRLDGTMKRDDRTRAMDELKYNPRCEVLLVSLKAGGVGLNLTAAQRVYLMDPYWNPAVENQAVDRIHRLGQTRPVTTVKLIIENSIEARLLEVQKKKIDLANLTLGGQSYSKTELLQRRVEELEQLFG